MTPTCISIKFYLHKRYKFDCFMRTRTMIQFLQQNAEWIEVVNYDEII